MDIASRQHTTQTAALDGDFEELKSILEANPALATSIDEDKRTPLHWACVSGHVKCFLFLLSLPVDADQSELDIARIDQSDSTVGSFHININAQDEGGWTPLMIAISAGHEALYTVLLSLTSCDISLLNRGGQTALHFACSKARIPAVQAILSQVTGAKLVRIKDRQGQLPLHRAAAAGSTPIIKALIAAKSQLSPTDAGGWSALHHACSEGHGDAAVALIEAGIDVDAQDRDGETAIQLCPPDRKCMLYIKSCCPESFA